MIPADALHDGAWPVSKDGGTSGKTKVRKGRTLHGSEE